MNGLGQWINWIPEGSHPNCGSRKHSTNCLLSGLLAGPLCWGSWLGIYNLIFVWLKAFLHPWTKKQKQKTLCMGSRAVLTFSSSVGPPAHNGLVPVRLVLLQEQDLLCLFCSSEDDYMIRNTPWLSSPSAYTRGPDASVQLLLALTSQTGRENSPPTLLYYLERWL